MRDVERFTTAAGRTLYTFQARAFPRLVANITVISDGRRRILEGDTSIEEVMRVIEVG